MCLVPDPTQLGNVIRVIDKYTLLINVGKGDVNVGDKIQVYALGDPVTDIDGTILSHFVFVKDELDVVQVQERYSVCKKNKYVEHKSPYIIALSPLMDTKKERVPLNVQDSEISPLNIDDSNIHIGDFVKLA